MTRRLAPRFRRLSATFSPPVGVRKPSEPHSKPDIGQGYVPQEQMDEACNHMASHGFRLVSTTVTGKLELGRMRPDRIDLYLFFEREY